MARDGKRVQFQPARHCGQPADWWNPKLVLKRVKDVQAQLERETPGSYRYERKEALLVRLNDQLQKAQAITDDEDRLCRRTKGQGTDHPGVGRCKHHCRCKGRAGSHGRNRNLYRSTDNYRLQDALDVVDEAQIDIMDLSPEVQTLRALVLMFIDSSKGKDIVGKDLETAAKLLDAAGKMVERINAIKLKTAVTYEAVQMLVEQMGIALTKHSHKWNGKTFDAQQFVDAVRFAWANINVDVNSRTLPNPGEEG